MKIPVILGPTASGKTSIGIALAKLINGEVISVDSRKVYRGLPIGTATPPGRWGTDSYVVDGVAHHLMAFLPPDKPYTAGDFAKDAEDRMDQIVGRGHVPVLVGGTGFYFKALRDGLPVLPHRKVEFRRTLEDRIVKNGLASLYQELKEIDPAAAVDRNDRHKIIRALEVTHLTGRPYSSFRRSPKETASRSYVVIGIDHEKNVLENRIRARAQKMTENGMIEEAAHALEEGYAKNCPALSSFGYREAVDVLEGSLSRENFLPALIKGTLAYAKRQRTWFRTKTPPEHRFLLKPPIEKQEIALKIRSFL